MGFAKNISDIFKKFLNGQDKRKILENSIIVIIIGVILIVAGGTIFTKNVDIYSSTNKQDNFNLEPSERNVVNSNDSVEVSNSVSKNSLEERMENGIENLPSNLAEAIEELKKDEVIKEALGPHVYNLYIEAKKLEWDDYRRRVHQWELDQYLTRF